ncbi:MAG: arylesterase [Pseudomonadota bacterium]
MKRVYRILVMVAWWSLAPLAMAGEPQNPAASDDATVLIVGDSLSAAYGIATEEAWVTLLRQRLDEKNPGWSVANASISGETTDGGLRRLPGLLEKHQPEVVVIELGGNDGLRGFPPPLIRQNLSRMIQHAKGADAKVLLVGIELPPNLGDRYNRDFRALFPDLAKEHDIAVVPFVLEGIYDREGMMQEDGVHPTAKAQPLVLENIWEALSPLL